MNREADGSWPTVTWDDLPVVDPETGEPIMYVVRELPVSGYVTQILATNPGQFEVLDTHEPATVSVSAMKVWADNDDSAGLRPGYAVFHLLKNGVPYGEAKVAYGDMATVVWTGLPANEAGLPTVENGLPITYFVEEDPLDGYDTSYADGTYSEDGSVLSLMVTNTEKGDEPGPGPGPGPGPEPSGLHWISFVDALNSEGTQMLVYKRLTDEEYAAIQQAYEANKPADPVHEGYSFQQWDKNERTTAEGDVLVMYVARYQQTPPASKVTVTYVDPQAGEDALIFTQLTDDPDSLAPGTPGAPADPSHKDSIFEGWVRTVDAAGNIVYTAVNKSDCQGGGTDPDTPVYPPSGDDSSGTKNTPTYKNLPNTGDSLPILPVAVVAGVAVVAAVVALVMRRRKD